jgi:hypothetical protein
VVSEEKMKVAQREFAQWFASNYPGPDTIIHDPFWHAPKVFRAALNAIERGAGGAATSYRNTRLSELLVEHSQAASGGNVDGALKARDAIYSMFANVAQGAGAELEFMPVDSMQHAIVYGSKAAIGALKARMERDYRIASLVPAPPAQTALTATCGQLIAACTAYNEEMQKRNTANVGMAVPDAMRKAIDAAMTAAQSASGDTKCGQ